jgi:hypothetical protein
MFDVSAILRPGNRHDAMLMTINTKAFHVEAAPVASTLSCRPKRWLDDTPALAGRCAR